MKARFGDRGVFGCLFGLVLLILAGLLIMLSVMHRLLGVSHGCWLGRGKGGRVFLVR